MREIEFRWKKIQDGIYWLYGSYVIHENIVTRNWSEREENRTKETVYRIIPYNLDCRNLDVDPETVGQYTGLKDKNGKKIYEGDVLNIYFKPNTYKSNYEVFYEAGAFYAKQNINKGKTLWWTEYGEYYELHYLYNNEIRIDVIGNIHENADLLNK